MVVSCLWRAIFWCLFLFFFKQKTAYEMRISDWSSDVCSSELRGRRTAVRLTLGRRRGLLRLLEERIVVLGRLAGRRLVVAPGGSASRTTGARNGSGADRKSVVSGKRVSVRVDLGGRRIIKNKTSNIVCFNVCVLMIPPT